MGSLVLLLFQCSLCVRHLRLEHPGSSEFDESDKEKSDKLGSGSGLFGTCSTSLGGLLHGIEFSIDVTFDGNDGSFGCGGSGG